MIRKFQGAGINRQNGESGDRVGKGQLALPCITGWVPQPHPLFLPGLGVREAKELQPHTIQMHVRALGEIPPCMLYLSLQLLKVIWIGKLFSF